LVVQELLGPQDVCGLRVARFAQKLAHFNCLLPVQDENPEKRGGGLFAWWVRVGDAVAHEEIPRDGGGGATKFPANQLDFGFCEPDFQLGIFRRLFHRATLKVPDGVPVAEVGGTVVTVVTEAVNGVALFVFSVGGETSLIFFLRLGCFLTAACRHPTISSMVTDSCSRCLISVRQAAPKGDVSGSNPSFWQAAPMSMVIELVFMLAWTSASSRAFLPACNPQQTFLKNSL